MAVEAWIRLRVSHWTILDLTTLGGYELADMSGCQRRCPDLHFLATN